jgi:holo-[acyl-carrier protein] synthase
MIYGIGVDLVNINRMEQVLKKWGSRFVDRIFTPDEASACYRRAFRAAAFALRFAAKEAFSKAIGLGMRNGIRWREIEVFNLPSGKPGIKLTGKASQICRKEGIWGIHLSLSDEREHCVAMVVLEAGGKGESPRQNVY